MLRLKSYEDLPISTSFAGCFLISESTLLRILILKGLSVISIKNFCVVTHSWHPWSRLLYVLYPNQVVSNIFQILYSIIFFNVISQKQQTDITHLFWYHIYFQIIGQWYYAERGINTNYNYTLSDKK